MRDFINIFRAWNSTKNLPIFGLKLKYAVWIIPIPFLLHLALWILYFLLLIGVL